MQRDSSQKTNDGSMINFEGLTSQLEAMSHQWQTATPFPNVIMPNFLLPGVCEEIAAGFESVLLGQAGKDPSLPKKHRDVSRKIGTSNAAIMTDIQQQFFREVNSIEFVNFIEQLTGIKPLFSDPDLQGGGLHQTFPGGYLNLHSDFNCHPKTGLLRKLNLILYLNENWQPEWNGFLELRDLDLREEPTLIAPAINTAAMFETTETSWHGHTKPLACPEDRSRKSLAVYYYAPWPKELTKRSKTRYILTPAQQETLNAEIATQLKLGKSETEVVAELTNWQPSHVTKSYRLLRKELFQNTTKTLT